MTLLCNKCHCQSVSVVSDVKSTVYIRSQIDSLRTSSILDKFTYYNYMYNVISLIILQLKNCIDSHDKLLK